MPLAAAGGNGSGQNTVIMSVVFVTILASLGVAVCILWYKKEVARRRAHDFEAEFDKLVSQGDLEQVGATHHPLPSTRPKRGPSSSSRALPGHGMHVNTDLAAAINIALTAQLLSVFVF